MDFVTGSVKGLGINAQRKKKKNQNPDTIK